MAEAQARKVLGSDIADLGQRLVRMQRAHLGLDPGVGRRTWVVVEVAVGSSWDTDKGKVGRAEHVQLCRVFEKVVFHQMLGWDEMGVENVGIQLEMLVQ